MSALLDSPAPVREGLSLEQAQAVVDHLARELGVGAPRIVWTRGRRGHYRVADNALLLGPLVWRGVNTVVHEFAHHLDVLRRTQHGAPLNPRGRRRTWHGPSFCQALRDCAAVVWPCATMYAWGTEYASVRRWWEMHGPNAIENMFERAQQRAAITMGRVSDGQG